MNKPLKTDTLMNTINTCVDLSFDKLKDKRYFDGINFSHNARRIDKPFGIKIFYELDGKKKAYYYEKENTIYVHEKYVGDIKMFMPAFMSLLTYNNFKGPGYKVERNILVLTMWLQNGCAWKYLANI